MNCLAQDISALLAILAGTGAPYNIEKIKSAFEFAKELHAGQTRKSGEPYISHPIAVAEIAASLKLDTDAICASLLHDTIEDCPGKVDLAQIKRRFGEDTAIIVDGVTKLISLPYADRDEQKTENLRKMFLAMSKDLRVIFIKLCDRLHNMRTLSSHDEEKQRLIALETMYVFAPLAHRLGIHKIKAELELLALQYLDPIGFDEVKREVDKKYGQNKDFLLKAQDTIKNKLKTQNFQFSIEGRVKSIYSMYKKMYNQHKSFNEIYDFYAIRILVNNELECYTVLGLIHEMFKSMPGRFKDYISTPKPNLYRSLHTTVIGRDGIPFEVQIRTWEMHAEAQYGLAAHWKYKTGAQGDVNLDKKLHWIHTLLESEGDVADPDDFIRPLKIDIFQDETFVFTPKGDVVNLPAGATGIDFAYAIHTEVGNKMVGLKINGTIAPIDTALETGQIVEVITSNATRGPKRNWLNSVKTSEARNKIRQWYKKEQREENILYAKSEVDKMFRKLKGIQSEDERNEVLSNIAKRERFNSTDELLNAIGYGGVSLSKITQKIKLEIDRINVGDTTQTTKQVLTESTGDLTNLTGGVIVDELDNCKVKYAKCCNPLPGDSIIGFITRGHGISIHKYTCSNVVAGLANLETRDRFLSASWTKKSLEAVVASFESQINIVSFNTVHLLADISNALADMHVGVLSISSRMIDEDHILLIMTVKTRNTEHLNSIVSKLKRLPDITRVTRA